MMLLPTNTQVYKVGRTTGLTTGVVTNTCSDRFFAGNIELLCQYMVPGLAADVQVAAGGDSGAAVFSGGFNAAIHEGVVVGAPATRKCLYLQFELWHKRRSCSKLQW
jgi:hypothetical protein